MSTYRKRSFARMMELERHNLKFPPNVTSPAPRFVSADKLRDEACPICRERPAGFMGQPCEACAARLTRTGGAP